MIINLIIRPTKGVRKFVVKKEKNKIIQGKEEKGNFESSAHSKSFWQESSIIFIDQRKKEQEKKIQLEQLTIHSY